MLSDASPELWRLQGSTLLQLFGSAFMGFAGASNHLHLQTHGLCEPWLLRRQCCQA